MVGVIVIFYFFLSLIGLGLMAWRLDEDSAFNPLGMGGEGWALYLAVSLGIVGAVHLGSVWAARHWPSLARGVAEMGQWLGGLSRAEVFAVALASGVAEEIFFRGWLLNEAGLLFSSLVFGLVHVPPTRNWLYWPIFAFVMGLGLGGLCLWTNSLIYAILVHVGINFINILRLPSILPESGAGTGVSRDRTES